MRRVIILEITTSIADIMANIVQCMPWLENNPIVVKELSPTFLTAYRKAMSMSEKFICIPFKNVFKNLLMIVGKQ